MADHRPWISPLAPVLRIGVLILAVSSLSACAGVGSMFTSFGDAHLQSNDISNDSPEEALRKGKAFFADRDYGRAEVAFRRAVELMPNNGESWLGLAASYDRLKRFDMADRAYGEAKRIVGSRAELYNNLGYSYLLRGDMVQARANFLKAQELAPSDPTISNNLAMLRASVYK